MSGCALTPSPHQAQGHCKVSFAEPGLQTLSSTEATGHHGSPPLGPKAPAAEG